LSPQSSSLWDYLSTIGGYDLWRSFLRPQPELDQAADGFGAAGQIVLLFGPFSRICSRSISRLIMTSATHANGTAARRRFQTTVTKPGVHAHFSNRLMSRR
jgi:hypothetical protein